jgi:hypothetical protein
MQKHKSSNSRSRELTNPFCSNQAAALLFCLADLTSPDLISKHKRSSRMVDGLVFGYLARQAVRRRRWAKRDGGPGTPPHKSQAGSRISSAMSHDFAPVGPSPVGALREDFEDWDAKRPTPFSRQKRAPLTGSTGCCSFFVDETAWLQGGPPPTAERALVGEIPGATRRS